MNDFEEQLHQVEISVDQAKQSIKFAEALERLHSNKDFKEVILEGYFRDEASRLVLLKSDPEMQDKARQRDVMNAITAVGGLFGYFNKVFTFGTIAKRTLKEDEDTKQAILQEQMADEPLQ